VSESGAALVGVVSYCSFESQVRVVEGPVPGPDLCDGVEGFVGLDERFFTEVCDVAVCVGCFTGPCGRVAGVGEVAGGM